MPRLARPFLLPVFAFGIAACDSNPTDSRGVITPVANAKVENKPANASVLSNLGGRIFSDPNLSLRQNQSCASCHDQSFGFTSPNTTINANGAVMFGSVHDRFGQLKPPSAAYATQSPVMFTDEEGTIIGGNFWNGRATGARLGSPAAEQALAPFVNAVEMALPDVACVLYRISAANYAGLFNAAWGKGLASIKWPKNTNQLCQQEHTTVPLSPADRATVMAEYDHVGLAIAAFEASDDVNQFSSKYDAYLAGKAKLTDLEKQGLGLYEGKAGCFGCHPSAGTNALFTDYSFDNIGVPSNPKNPAKLADATFRDLGLGGFLHDPSVYGAQKVPTLRNLDKRGYAGAAKSFMHNGYFKSLDDVVHFYNTRDVLPNCGSVPNPSPNINCWPTPEVTGTVNMDELGNLGLTPQEERAVVAYLKTLSDGYTKKQDK